MEMVRLGIGLYGINPIRGADKAVENLQEVASLHALISQIHAYPAGTSIGYGRSEYTQRDSRIATLPIGYADGILRILGNGRAHFLLPGKKVPTFGRICMDMLMLEVTDIPEAQAGDEVIIFGHQAEAHISVSELAEQADTIAYEILTRISSRVRRIYLRE
jgi:alanine racemase